MDYRQLLEDAAKFQKETNVRHISLNLGKLTVEEEAIMLSETNLVDNKTHTGTYTIMKSCYYYPEDSMKFSVVFNYEIPNTTEDKIADLEKKLAALKGEVSSCLVYIN